MNTNCMPDLNAAPDEKLDQWKRQYEAEIQHCKEHGFKHDVPMLIECLDEIDAIIRKRRIKEELRLKFI